MSIGEEQSDRQAPALPAVNYLGHGVCLMAPTNPFSVDEVITSTERYQIIHPDWTVKEPITIPNTEKEYRLPGNFRYDYHGQGAQFNDLEIETGSNLAAKFQDNASLGARYMGITVSAEEEYEVENTFETNSYCGVFSRDQKTYSASVRPQDSTWDNINTEFLDELEYQSDWTVDNYGVIEDWKALFKKWGTHVIVEAVYGNRYQFQVTSAESNLDSERWRACVQADFKGIVSSSGDLVSDSEMETYMNKTIKAQCKGGDPAKAMVLSSNPQ